MPTRCLRERRACTDRVRSFDHDTRSRAARLGWLRSGRHARRHVLGGRLSLRGAHARRILEEEDALIAAHRSQIEDTMAIVRQEMNLLGEVRVRRAVLSAGSRPGRPACRAAACRPRGLVRLHGSGATSPRVLTFPRRMSGGAGRHARMP